LAALTGLTRVKPLGRQPRTVFGQLLTADAASVLPVGEVLTGLGTFAVLYTVLLIFALYFGTRIIAKGPDLSLQSPNGIAATVLSDPTPSA
jgi:cytochrome d ubiquinol oxidase subunit I